MAYNHLTQLFKTFPLNDQYKCVRNSVIRRLLEEAPAHLKTKNVDVESKCQLCSANFNNTIRNRILVPFKRPNRCLRRLLQNNAENGTEYQKLSLKKYQKYAAIQKLIQTCQLCNHKQELVIENDTPTQDDKIPIGDKEIIKSKKKKKNNAFAGLNKTAVLTVKKARRIMTMDDIQIKRKLDTNLKKSICVDSTPSRKINNTKIETSDFINLDTPKSTSKNSNNYNPKSSAVINLCSPNTPTKNSSVIDLSTPGSTKKTKKSAVINLCTPNTATKNSNVIDLSTPCSTKKTKKKKRSTVVLSPITKPAKKAKKLDELSKLLQPDTKLNNTVSKLEQFLKVISK